MKRLAHARLQDAKVLFEARRYDGAVYLCGYAVELALKLRICRTLKWPGYPATRREFENYGSLKVHNLNVLLSFTGHEDRIKVNYLPEWSAVITWDPEVRYRPIGSASRSDARSMIEAADTLLKVI